MFFSFNQDISEQVCIMKYLLDISNIVAIEGMPFIFESLGANSFKKYVRKGLV